MTTLYALLGQPVGHSVSPRMMNRAFEHRAIDATYIGFSVTPQNLDRALAGLDALGAGGANVTIPHKTAVFQHVGSVSVEAQLAGAVNTLVRGEDGHFVGHNTDVLGWWQSVAEHAACHTPSRVLVVGAGGGARAVIVGLMRHCSSAQIRLTARRSEQARQLAAEFAEHTTIQVVEWADRHPAAAVSDWFIQTTPVGMWPHPTQSVLDDDSCLFPGQLVQDIVYRPLTTQILKSAARRGAIVVDGLAMLVGQGARAFELWTNQAAPLAEMRAAALAALT